MNFNDNHDDIYNDVLNMAFEKSLNVFQNLKTWFNDTIFDLITLRDKFHYIKRNKHEVQSFVDSSNHYDKSAKKHVREAKQKYYKKRNSPIAIQNLYGEETIKSCISKNICEEAYNYFLSVADNMSFNFPSNYETSDLSKWTSMFLKSTDYLEIEVIINSLNIKNSPGFDRISTKFLSQLRQNSHE